MRAVLSEPLQEQCMDDGKLAENKIENGTESLFCLYRTLYLITWRVLTNQNQTHVFPRSAPAALLLFPALGTKNNFLFISSFGFTTFFLFWLAWPQFVLVSFDLRQAFKSCYSLIFKSRNTRLQTSNLEITYYSAFSHRHQALVLRNGSPWEGNLMLQTPDSDAWVTHVRLAQSLPSAWNQACFQEIKPE